jgi:hypothetical protein
VSADLPPQAISRLGRLAARRLVRRRRRLIPQPNGKRNPCVFRSPTSGRSFQWAGPAALLVRGATAWGYAGASCERSSRDSSC